MNQKEKLSGGLEDSFGKSILNKADDGWLIA